MGISQPINVGRELRNFDVKVIYCSLIERVKYKLEFFDLSKNIPIIVDGRLKKGNENI